MILSTWLFNYQQSQNQHDETDLVRKRPDRSDRTKCFRWCLAAKQKTSKTYRSPREAKKCNNTESSSYNMSGLRSFSTLFTCVLSSAISSFYISNWFEQQADATDSPGHASVWRQQRLRRSIKPGAPLTTLHVTKLVYKCKNSVKMLHLKDSRHLVSLAWTYLEILSMLAICFWFRMTSMAAHTHWTTLGSACLFFTTRDMISLFISVVGAAGRREISRFFLGSATDKGRYKIILVQSDFFLFVCFNEPNWQQLNQW